jgi:hypothetical protein
VAGEERVEERGWAYRRRRPEGTVLYEAVKDNLATLLEEASEVGRGLPQYVARDVSPVPEVRSAGVRLRAGLRFAFYSWILSQLLLRV